MNYSRLVRSCLRMKVTEINPIVGKTWWWCLANTQKLLRFDNFFSFQKLVFLMIFQTISDLLNNADIEKKINTILPHGSTAKLKLELKFWIFSRKKKKFVSNRIDVWKKNFFLSTLTEKQNVKLRCFWRKW